VNGGDVKLAGSEKGKGGPPRGVLRKNVILRWLRVRFAQECDFKGVGGGGSVWGTPVN
jgi:hypothetical protein